MSIRDELADLIYRTLNPEIQQDAGWVPTVDGTGNVACHIAADAVLARWELVPRSILGPGLAGAVREYFQHGFSDRVIMAAFPQLTAQQLATLRSTDPYGRTHPDYHGDPR